MEIRITPARCSGCRSCELACSFHHASVFSRVFSSLRIRRSEKTWKIAIERAQQSSGKRPACDYCEGEASPLCARFCTRGAIIALERTP